MTISKSMKFSAVRSFAKVVISEAGKGQTIAALVEDFNATAMMHGFDFLMIAKPGRVAKLIELMEHVLKRLDAMPEYAEPVPEVSDKQAAEHLEHAGWMRGQLVAHGIDPQDFEAAIAWCVGNGNIVPRYWISIYVDYIHGKTEPGISPATARALGYGRTVRVNMSDRDVVTLTADNPADANTARVLQDVINHGIGAFSADLAAGHTIHHALERVISGYDPAQAAYEHQLATLGEAMSHSSNWRPITEQESRAVYTDTCQYAHSKPNRLPRGKCALRMLSLGWVFNH